MKALSVNSYYATLILEGRKTIECKIIKDNTTIPHINNAKANAFLDLTGFTPADIWDVMPDGFTRS